MTTYTVTEATTFSLTHAKHLAAKVATDLKRIQRFYGSPTDEWIAAYETEVVALLKAGFFGTASYGFKVQGDWVAPTLKYTARDLAGGFSDDHDPGKVRPGADVNGASFHSFLSYSAAWSEQSEKQREAFKQTLPFQRGSGSEPGVNGYFVEDRAYSAGGRALNRSSVKSY